MRQAIAKRVDPGPDVGSISDKDACQAAHDENYDAEVKNKDEIGK